MYAVRDVPALPGEPDKRLSGDQHAMCMSSCIYLPLSWLPAYCAGRRVDPRPRKTAVSAKAGSAGLHEKED